MNKINELKAERARLIAQAREINDRAEQERRDFDAVERESWDKHMGAAEALKERIERAEALDRETASLNKLEERAAPPTGTNADERQFAGLRPEMRDAMRGLATARPEVAAEGYRANFRNYIATGETRNLVAQNDAQGGYMVPTDFVASLLEKVRDTVAIRQLATNYILTNGDSVGRPTVETDVSDADWTSEIGPVQLDTALRFGKRELHPHDLTKRVLVSQKLLRSSAINPETVIRDQLAYKFGVSEEKGFLLGNGAGQPLGVFVSSNEGIPAARNISTGNTSTSIGADGLFEAKYALKDGYLRSASTRWMFHRDALKQIAKLKDGEGRYLFLPDVREAAGDRILGIQVVSSEFVPNTFTAGQFVGIIGDFSYYWIATSLGLSVQRLVELYAATGQVGFIGRHAVDGMPTFGDAFARVTLA
jgi:HK97 family phage major capsid protein